MAVSCREESSIVLSGRLQSDTTAVVATQNDEWASQGVVPTTNHLSSSQKEVLYNQDSFLLELENTEPSQSNNAVGNSKLKCVQIMKAVKDVPAPKLCSHTEWKETNVVSPVEELQKRLIKHASIIPPEVMEDSGEV